MASATGKLAQISIESENFPKPKNRAEQWCKSGSLKKERILATDRRLTIEPKNCNDWSYVQKEETENRAVEKNICGMSENRS